MRKSEKGVAPAYDSKADTLEHIRLVNAEILDFCQNLLVRAKYHDQSKLGEIEKPGFDEWTPILKDLQYGSKAYKKSLDQLRPYLEHHYANNRHHPEHFSNGIEGMNLLDVVEMLLDWKAAASRTKDGSIFKSLPINIERFGIEPGLAKILHNTAETLWFGQYREWKRAEAKAGAKLVDWAIDVIAASRFKPVVVDFYADWCGPCKRVLPVLDELKAAGAVVVKLDVDVETDLAKFHDVKSIPRLQIWFGGEKFWDSVDVMVGRAQALKEKVMELLGEDSK